MTSGCADVRIHIRASLQNHRQMGQECNQPELAEAIKVTPWLPNGLDEPQATVQGCKHPGVQREIHNPAEVPVPGIRRVSVAVPAYGHWEVALLCSDSCAWMCPG